MLEIFSYDFMVRAFITGGIIAVIAPLAGLFLVVRRYSLMADTLSHVSLVGIAGALVANINPLWGALAVSVLASLGLDCVQRNKRIFGDAALALFFSGSLALALIMVSTVKGLNALFFNFLFGSITAIASPEMITMLILGFGVGLIILLFYKELFATSFDPEYAHASGMRVQIINGILMLCAGLLIALSMRVVGALLIGALMVIPVIGALQWQLNFLRTALVSALFSIVATFIGLYASYYLNLPSGASIVATSVVLCVISMTINKK